MTSVKASWLGSGAITGHEFFSCEICTGLNGLAMIVDGLGESRSKGTEKR